jgi:hypothetical protein
LLERGDGYGFVVQHAQMVAPKLEGQQLMPLRGGLGSALCHVARDLTAALNLDAGIR